YGEQEAEPPQLSGDVEPAERQRRPAKHPEPRAGSGANVARVVVTDGRGAGQIGFAHGVGGHGLRGQVVHVPRLIGLHRIYVVLHHRVALRVDVLIRVVLPWAPGVVGGHGIADRVPGEQGIDEAGTEYDARGAVEQRGRWNGRVRSIRPGENLHESGGAVRILRAFDPAALGGDDGLVERRQARVAA